MTFELVALLDRDRKDPRLARRLEVHEAAGLDRVKVPALARKDARIEGLVVRPGLADPWASAADRADLGMVSSEARQAVRVVVRDGCAQCAQVQNPKLLTTEVVPTGGLGCSWSDVGGFLDSSE